MKTDLPIAPEAIRLLFELDRDDNPRLYDDLIRFRKGAKRVNRLRTLAHEGLMAQYFTPAAIIPTPKPKPALLDEDGAALIRQALQAPLED